MTQFRSPVLLPIEEQPQPQPKAGSAGNGGKRPPIVISFDQPEYDPEAIARITVALSHTLKNRRALRRVKEVQ